MPPERTSNGASPWVRMVLTALLSSVGTLVIGFSSGLMALGASQQQIQEHLTKVEPLIGQTETHLHDREAHLSEVEAQAIAQMPEIMRQIERRLSTIEVSQQNIYREMRKW